ncbi:MAG TPA: flagellar motor protein MotB [Bdellovibrionota bacterium]|nr:flagellar motor protein MotB [Bdellovibrionota bacterium]
MKTFRKPATRRGEREIWQVIYIDLLSNMMCFFIILWAINQGRKVKLIETQGDTTARMVSLPGDVIFSPGKTLLSNDGRQVFEKLFKDESGAVLRFESNALRKRLLVIHGHTDGDGKKDDNFNLAFGRALSAYHEIARYSPEVPEHVVLCSHADNTPAEDVPALKGNLTPAQKDALKTAKAKNRRIQIEDSLVSRQLE